MYPVQLKTTQPQQPAVDIDYTLLIVDLRILISRRGTRKPSNVPCACFRLIRLAQRYCRHYIIFFALVYVSMNASFLSICQGIGLTAEINLEKPDGRSYKALSTSTSHFKVKVRVSQAVFVRISYFYLFVFQAFYSRSGYVRRSANMLCSC